MPANRDIDSGVNRTFLNYIYTSWSDGNLPDIIRISTCRGVQ